MPFQAMFYRRADAVGRDDDQHEKGPERPGPQCHHWLGLIFCSHCDPAHTMIF
jgi:hypothetical protein